MNDRIRHREFETGRRIWQAGRTDMRLGDALGRTVVAAGQGEDGEQFFAVEVAEAGHGEVRVNSGFLGHKAMPTVSVVPSSRRLDDHVKEHAGMTTTRAMLTPEVRWPGVVADRRSVNWPVLVGGLVLSLVAGHYLGPPGYALWLVSVIATIVLPGPKVRETQIHRAGNKRPYSLKHVADRMAELPATPERDSLVVGRVPVPGSQHQAAARVEAVKERYGELRSDVAYRIEHSALFDPAVEQTRDLTLLLARWDDGGASGEDTVELVREVELAFEAARAHAERVGLAHLPLEVRADADRAAKAARVASGAETDGERAAAIEQVNRLLASIALYYLPGPEEAAVALRGHRTEIRGDG